VQPGNKQNVIEILIFHLIIKLEVYLYFCSQETWGKNPVRFPLFHSLRNWLSSIQLKKTISLPKKITGKEKLYTQIVYANGDNITIAF